MQVPEPRQPDDALVHARVVLHRAGAERVEARVDPEVARRELREVADEIRLGDLRQAGRVGTTQLRRDLGDRETVGGNAAGAPSGTGFLEDQLQLANTSARRSISSVVRRSVIAISSASSSPG